MQNVLLEKETINVFFFFFLLLQTFATLSPIPGYMQWLLSKLSSQSRFAEEERGGGTQSNPTSSTFSEKVLLPEEEQALMSLSE